MSSASPTPHKTLIYQNYHILLLVSTSSSNKLFAAKLHHNSLTALVTKTLILALLKCSSNHHTVAPLVPVDERARGSLE